MGLYPLTRDLKIFTEPGTSTVIIGWFIKKWTVSFCCLQRVGIYYTHAENVYNIPTARKTLIKMMLNEFTFCCNN